MSPRKLSRSRTESIVDLYTKKLFNASFTYEGGRQIYRDGKPFISIGREGDTQPVDADDAAKIITELLRYFAEMEN